VSPSSGTRVLILVENLSVPFDRRVWQQARSLTAVGYDVTVVCPRGATYDLESEAEIDGVRIVRYALKPATGGPMGYLREYGTALWRSWRAIHCEQRARGRFAIVHACNPPDLLFLSALPVKLRGARLIFDHHDLSPELFESRFGRRGPVYQLLLWAERLTYATSDVAIATNESYRRIAIGRGRKPADEVFVVRSAPDPSRFAPTDPDPTLRRGKQHLACYLGVMGPQDGVDYALRAIAYYRRTLGRDDLRTVFIGSGDAEQAYRRLATALGLDDCVHFTGRVPDETLRAYLSTADVCLSPDPKNPLNDVSTMNKLMEYMAMGRPIVSFDLSEARVSAADAAVYAPANDVAAFAKLMADLLDAPERRAEMGRIARQRIGGSLSWAAAEQALHRAYARALGVAAVEIR
jgi:glycosyltransferase involved in cell wall biosynthesis